MLTGRGSVLAISSRGRRWSVAKLEEMHRNLENENQCRDPVWPMKNNTCTESFKCLGGLEIIHRQDTGSATRAVLSPSCVVRIHYGGHMLRF